MRVRDKGVRGLAVVIRGRLARIGRVDRRGRSMGAGCGAEHRFRSLRGIATKD